ncbi:MAG: hypothetical protein HY913_24445 [Desulfomonile tiedjei]|nr:hypothetical protein [Desulfomonile tiedjei]
MTRHWAILIALAIIVTCLAPAFAQDVTSSSFLSGGSPVGTGQASFPGLNVGDISIWPTVKLGYKALGLNFNLNIPPTQVLSPFLLFPNYGSLLDSYPLDAKIQHADLLVGGIRVDTRITPTLNFFGSISANVPRTIGFQASEGPAIGQIPPQAWDWTGSRLQWSQYELGGSCRIAQNLAFVAGIKFDRTTVRFSDPEPIPSYGLLVFTPFPTIQTFSFPDYGGDFDARFTIPYIGCEILGPYFKGTMIAGLASGRLRLPLNLNHGGTYFNFLVPFLGRQDISEQAEYAFSKTGLFLEGIMESSFPVTDRISLNAWLKGSWLRIRGSGDVNLNGQSSLFFFVFALPEPFSSSASGTSTLTQYSFDVGFSGAINF